VTRKAGSYLALTLWCYACWVLLTWTATLEFLATGLLVALVVAAVLAPFGDTVRPWALIRPRRMARALVLAGEVGWNIARANVDLARRIWSPHMPLATGMVVVPTRERSDGGLAGVGLLTSLVVDNQVVDVDRARGELLYHCVEVPEGDAETRYQAINGRVERRIAALEASDG
jgi:multicomponent Na+:H+ antiporter subunit E